jgi:hypothetical protein
MTLMMLFPPVIILAIIANRNEGGGVYLNNNQQGKSQNGKWRWGDPDNVLGWLLSRGRHHSNDKNDSG